MAQVRSTPSTRVTQETRLIRAGAHDGELVKTVGPPIQKGSTVLLPNAAALYDDDSFLTYGRAGLAAHDALRQALSEMEGAAGVCLYPSGLSAVTGAVLAVLQAGDEVLAADNIYKPSRRFCDNVLKRYGIGVRYFDPRLSPEALLDLTGERTRLIMMESPGSLTFEMMDLAAVAELAKAKGVLTLTDNTWGAGYLFKPLEHGVDISVQALTKYVGGHSDVFMGSAAARDPALVHQLAEGVHNLGWSVSADDAYQMLRGLRTLPARLKAQGESGLRIATWLAAQPEVAEVIHPALPGAADHALWARDYSGACGLFGFALKGGTPQAADAFLDALKLFGLGFSWGGFESLAIVSDPQLGKRKFAPTYDGPLMRLHIGLETEQDLMADLRRGLDAFSAAR
ncbi:cystathionine beta-lyase [Phenylobacterium sp. NIBR 498073]|uniref:cystathionine beta-lyase n=1 Tax=Phenylobacterium sp. NIBR 498073 TaxID=3015177 RepID=UPI0022B48CF9|nr:cystathionine beta-lyase [Phenylobacterium sp. NIBR 498073]WGU38445.1 cystathionine beta-lyase [Phenylobacterium sp. NIBR 498073]